MRPLASRVAAIARVEPTRTALVDADRRLSYTALWQQVRALAAQFWKSGLGRGDRVALILPNGIEAVVACYATWLAGAVVVPLNAQARARDFTVWLAHSDARFVVCEEDHRDVSEALRALASPPTRITAGVDGFNDARADAAHAADVPTEPAALDEIASHDLAMLLYTSGTTGQPKGVMLSHANLAANTDSIVAYLGLDSSDSIVASLPFYYSYGASVLHTHLAVGARLVIERNLVFPHVMVETMVRERVSGFAGVPSSFVLLLNRVPLAQFDLSALRYVTQAGGAMAPAVIQRLRAALPQARLFVMYGQTEASARLTWLPPARLDEKPGSAGLPIAGVRIEVRDDAGAALPAGTPGEVWVCGANVMRGYWKDPAASAAVLHDGWLKTGDMGHLDEEGFLFLCGRRSDMIKTGAHRVHPQDIEEVIAELDSVAEVAVVGVDDDVLGQTIKAFVVSATSTPLSAEQIKAHCRARLAPYKIPKEVETVDSLPRTASGKIRRAQLMQESR